MENKKAFLMYLEYEEQLSALSDEELGKLLRAIFKYEKTGEETKLLGSLLQMAFGFIKGNLNRDREKYDKRAETSAINGKKGGRPRNKKPNEKPNEKPKKPKKADIDIVTVIETDKDNDTVIENEIDNDSEIVVDDCFTYCEKQFMRTLAPTEYETLASWKEWYDDKIINLAIDKTVKNNVRALSYTEKIINTWHDKGYKTYEQCLGESKIVRKREKVAPKEIFDYDWLNE